MLMRSKYRRKSGHAIQKVPL
eukprot:COSAG02_NODE_63559_length_263_cov_0.560976_1_plen_20_part_10